MLGATQVFSTPSAARRAQKAKQEDIEQAIGLAQYSSALRTKRFMQRDPRVPADIGAYKAGLEVHRLRYIKQTRLEANAPHSGVLEHGARPFWAPIAPLIEWAKRKAADLGIVDVPAGQQFQGPASLNADENRAAEAFAYAVQRAIAARGLPARYPMRNALPFALKALDRDFIRHLRRIARERRGPGGGTK